MSLDRDRPPFASFILPVYNGEAVLESTLASVGRWLRERPEAWELIVVDDASTDGTPRILEAFMRRHAAEAITRIRFAANRGKGFATRTGLGVARGEYALFTDCDLAYPIENAGRILQELGRGADVAIACRVLPQSTYLIGPSFFSYLYTRHLMGRAFNLLCRVLTVPRLLDTQAGLKGFRTSVIRPLLGRLVVDGFSFDVELLRGLLDRGARIVEVPVSFRYDSEPSTVSFLLDSLRMVRDLVRVRLRSLRGCYRSVDAVSGPTGLIVQADDFGLAVGVNRAIEEGLESGVLSGASILVNAPRAAEALAWAAAHPRFAFGVHLNLTGGRPVLPAAEVPSLVTSKGEFPGLRWFLFRFLLGRVRLEEVRREWEAQIAVARRAGVHVGHLDSHQHVHLLPRLFRRVMAPLARRERLETRRMDGPIMGPWADPKGILLALATRRSLDAESRRASGARGFGTAFMRRPTLRRLSLLLSRTRPGRVYEFVVHPGRVDDELRLSGESYLEGREAEARLIGSAEFRAVLRHAGLEILPPGAGPTAGRTRSARP
ncbi:MAG TPA: ChbG/HpnK family deacetylase [Candidatus Polarisedimenticolia bacterium]|nr:ChbG/HpnK family deacetylase [Candidatus Polarisedimenticolia bacterium]